MADIRTITTMAKAGQVQEAYELAKGDLEAAPTNVWAQREVGWALYYLIKKEADAGGYDRLCGYIDELKALDLLTAANDSMIFDNVLLQLAGYIDDHLHAEDAGAYTQLSDIYSIIKDHSFHPSLGYSLLLQKCIGFKGWDKMADFIDWWNLDNLREEDYIPYQFPDGRKMMTLAERAYIAYSRALLNLHDSERIEAFLPRLDALMDAHPEFVYSGYYYGKLLLEKGSDSEEALEAMIPFARKKATEFWVWDLLSEMYPDGDDRQLACLLRAVHCRTQEPFLKNVRIKLAALYIQREQYGKARFQIDAVVRNCARQGWGLPNEVESWIHETWIGQVKPDGTDSLNYMDITNTVLCEGAEEAVAIVTYTDPVSHKVFVIYGHEQRTGLKLKAKVAPGDVLRLYYEKDTEGHIKVLNTVKISLPDDLSYAKMSEGTVSKQHGHDFAFLKSSVGRCFISPALVQKSHVADVDQVEALVVYDYNKKKECWNWICLSLRKK